MANVVLDDILSGNSTSKINENFQRIEDAFGKVLSKEESVDNSMSIALDMNGNRILNIGAPVDSEDLANKEYVDELTSANTAAINAIEVSGISRVESEEFIATAGQTTFTLTDIGFAGDDTLSVYVNGLRQYSDDYTTPASNSVQFVTPLLAGDEVLIVINESPASTINAEQIIGLNTPTVEDLLSVSVTDSEVVNVVSYHSDAEGGGGVFYWDALRSKAEHNGGTIIDPSALYPVDWTNQTQLSAWFTAGVGTGCWVRSNKENLTVLDFGAIGDGVVDNTLPFQAFVDSDSTSQIVIPKGTYLINSDVTAPNIVWYFRTGAVMTGAGVLDQEWNSIRESAYGMQYGGTLRIGKNSGAPSNPDANGGIIFGGYSDRTTEEDEDGIRMEGEGSNASNMVIYNTRKAGQTQINVQNRSVWGQCDVLGSTVTRVSGVTFDAIDAAKFIVIDYVKYEILSIDSADQITLVASAPTQSNVKYRIATVYNNTVASISGVTATRLRGEVFTSNGTTCLVNGVRYGYTHVSSNEITLDSAPGDTAEATVLTMQGDIGATVMRLQVQPGSNEQSHVWAYNEEIGYFLSSVVTGSGEHRPLRIAQGVKNTVFNTDGSVQFFESITVNGVPVINDFGITLGKYDTGGSHPNANITDNNVNSISANKTGGGNGGLAVDLFSDGVHTHTPVYYNQSGHWIPGQDGAYSIGSAARRMATVYAISGTINTSDDREKTYLEITEAETAVAKELKTLLKKFKWNDSIATKGEEARIHFGASAQTIKSVFEKHGLVAEEYGLLCFDEWEEVVGEDGVVITPSGNRYGVRYEELLCFIVSAL